MLLEAALAYASQGFHVFPILPGQKRPLTKHGFKEATTDPEQIRAWWTANPTANIGCWWDPAGMCAVDLDIGAPTDLDLPRTMMVKTPSGGRHLIYQGRMPDTQRKIAPHVDTRGIAGYTILPPSIVDGRPYEWINDEWPQPLPEWVSDFFTKFKPEPRERIATDIDTPERIARVREIAAGWEPAIEYQGSNDATIELANRLLDLCSHNVVFVAMWELWAPRCIGEWTASWLGDKVDSLKPGSGRDSDIGCEEYPIEYGYKPEWEKKRQYEMKVILKSGEDLKLKKIIWVWNGWLAAGKFHLIAGCPGAGKSTLCFDLMARVTAGGKWPDGTKAPLGDVLIWSGEDNLEDTILPRFIVSGGVRKRFKGIAGVTDGDETTAFDPSIHMGYLLKTAETLPELKLVIIDPIVNAIGARQDSHKNAEVRRGLQPLVDFAEARGVVLLGITHFTKGTEGRDPTERVTGSLAFGALARVVLAASADEDGEQRYLVRAKSNISPTGGGFEYRLRQDFIESADMWAQRIVWGQEIKGSARDLLGGVKKKAVDRAMEFFLGYLADGPKRSKDITIAASEHGINAAALYRARTASGLKPKQDADGWFWELPPTEGNPA